MLDLVARANASSVARRKAKEATPQLLVSLLLDTRALASKMRYIIKQYHKLVEALPPEVAATYTFCIMERTPARVDPWLEQRFERTTIERQFYHGDKFATDFAKVFAQRGEKVAILFPDEAERNIAVDNIGTPNPYPGITIER